MITQVTPEFDAVAAAGAGDRSRRARRAGRRDGRGGGRRPRRRGTGPGPAHGLTPWSRTASTPAGSASGGGRAWLVRRSSCSSSWSGWSCSGWTARSSGSSPAPVPTPAPTTVASTAGESHDWPTDLPAGTLYVGVRGPGPAPRRAHRTADARRGCRPTPRAASLTPLGDGVLVWQRGTRARRAFAGRGLQPPPAATATSPRPAPSCPPPAARCGPRAPRVGSPRGGGGSTRAGGRRRTSRSRARRWPTGPAACSASPAAASAPPTRRASSSARPPTSSPRAPRAG